MGGSDGCGADECELADEIGCFVATLGAISSSQMVVSRTQLQAHVGWLASLRDRVREKERALNEICADGQEQALLDHAQRVTVALGAADGRVVRFADRRRPGAARAAGGPGAA